jgi:seryl-tRNA synthetase
VSDADLQKQLELGLKVRDRLSEAHKTVNEMKEVQAGIAALKKRLGTDEKTKDIVTAGDDLNKKIEGIEDGLVQLKAKAGEDALNFPNRPADQLQALLSSIDGSDNAPTQQMYTVFDQLNGPIEEQIAKWKDLRERDLPALNDKIAKANIPAIAVTPPKEE